MVHKEILKKIKDSKVLNDDEHRLLEDLITKDELTQAHNRRSFNQDCRQEVERADRIKYDVGLLMLDIDYFKKYNDNYGHQKGDKLLKEVTDTIKTSIRDTDTVYRYGGEEFAIILPDTNLKGANIVAESIRKNIQEQTPITASIGISNYKQTSQNLHDFISHSDYALYEAKKHGRNQTTTYQPIK